ncbi:MAG: hypothetical protein OEY94_04565 [Alphaproteobacteria bacterium]|nr:hypothetical protein [Alphaproteobacteria bacterium]
MTFELLGLILFCIILLLSALIKKYRQWQKSSSIDAKIIGYKYSSIESLFLTISTNFLPVIEYKNNNREVISPIKNLNILVPDDRIIKLRLSADKLYCLKANFMHFIFLIVVLIFALTSLYMPKYEIVHYFLMASVFFYGVAIIIYIKDNLKRYGTLQNLLFFIPSRRPENYEEMTEADFKRIEESDLVSYEEAMAHYYHRNKKSEKWIFLLSILVAGYLLYKILGA